MMRWVSMVLVTVAVSGCGAPDEAPDTGSAIDAGGDVGAHDGGRDAHAVDAGAVVDVGPVIDGGMDAFGAVDAATDAFVAIDAGTDAFVAAHDAGTDAFVAADDAAVDAPVAPVDAGSDAFVPPVDAGHDAWVMPTCTDGMQNGTETDIDCGGGVCPLCPSGQGCLQHTDCVTGACNLATWHCSVTCTAPVADCNDYCNCMVTACVFYVDRTACLNACGSFDTAQLCCRDQHCGYALTDPVTHCVHAEGMSLCP